MPSLVQTLRQWRTHPRGAGRGVGAVGLLAHDGAAWLAHVEQGHGEDPPALRRWARAEGPPASAAQQFLRGCGRAPLHALLHGTQYQMLQLDAPAVPRAEWVAATRWQLKDYIDFDPAEAQLDCVAVPADDGSPGNRMFTVVSRQDTVRTLMLEHHRLRNPLRSIDVPEMALRNLLLLTGDGPAQALLHLGPQDCWIVLLWNADLATTRRFDIGLAQLAAADAEDRFALVERLALEFQRTSDAFARVYTQGELRCLWVSACAQSQELADELGAMLATAVSPFELATQLALPDDAPPADPDLLLAVGAALRHDDARP